ncbi:MAG TPA: sensor histidine kinase [Candidatus Paceibacterota bacterium]|nr:sensor histidine kinase [Verrucomicrobiota bacterium]HRY48827.1 sensor histidine kinase [Candidatus Paceibacterota bacterium]HRZ99637.1 sensor histidine kinase [Candidatus Paceibacterota bacterium]
MSEQIPLTEFVASERVPIAVIRKQASFFSQSPLALSLVNASGNALLILNQQRQIVFATETARKLTGAIDAKILLGKRPGEALGCVHAQETAHDCGKTQFCAHCGALKAIVSSLGGVPDTQECRMTRVINLNQEALDLLVTATPFQIEQERFTILSINDISHQKRRQALEKVFVQNLSNLTTSLEEFVHPLKNQIPNRLKDDVVRIQSGLNVLADELRTQRLLIAAEQGSLNPNLQSLQSAGVLSELQLAFARHPVCEGKTIQIDPDSHSVEFQGDADLVRCVLGILVKNALEAIESGQKVTLSCKQVGKAVHLKVHNPSSMTKAVQLQVFKRSFSTKSANRGLGTYTARLLADRFLKGKVTFQSNSKAGTMFCLTLPLR